MYIALARRCKENHQPLSNVFPRTDLLCNAECKADPEVLKQATGQGHSSVMLVC